jgi:hypothetical protein
MRTMLRSKVTLLFITCAVVLAIPAIALADTLTVNDVSAGGDVTKVQGTSGTAGAVITAVTDNVNNTDASGCNATGSTKATLTLTSSDTSRVNFGGNASASQEVAGCGTTFNFNYQVPASATPGTATITATATGGKTGSTYTSDSFTVTVIAPTPSDTTGPVITPHVDGTLGNGDWYVSDVAVTWDVEDNESAISSSSGCAPASVTTDTAGTTFTCTATSAGGTNSQSVTIKRDATAPTISGDASPDANANGWNNEPVTVGYTCADNLSGVASCGSADLLDTEGANQSATGSATDAAGNTADATVSGINIDLTKPTISATAERLDGTTVLGDYTAGNWTNKSVRVSFSCSDTLSEVDTNNVAGDTKTASGADQSVTNTGDCTDRAGNTADPATFSNIDIDKDLPTITGSRSPGANADGWNNTNVTVHFNCADQTLLSGIASCTPDQTVSNEAANQSVTGTATDNATNTASNTVNGISIDKTKPSVSVTGVSNGATYTLGSVPAAGCSTSDALSGKKTDATLQPLSGGPVGSVTATCSGAEDNAGNTGSASVTYNVEYAWTGFFQPVDNKDNSGNYILNKAKAGSVVPVKFSLGGDQGLNVLASGYPQTATIPCTASSSDVLEEYGTGNVSSFKYDPVANQYIYNWKTDTKWAGTCRQLVVKLADNTYHRANFNFTK